MGKTEMMAMLLAGGQGSRLGILTKEIAKPAVMFGGKYRIIDLMQEFQAEMVGVGVLMATKEPHNKLVDDFKTLVWIDNMDEANKKMHIYSAFK